MTSKNDITGDSIKSKTNSEEFRENHCKAFCKDKCGSPITCEKLKGKTPKTLKGDK